MRPLKSRLALLALLPLALLARPAAAVFHLAVIDEVMTSYNGDTTAQFVEIRMLAPFQNATTNSVFAAFDATGAFTGDVLVVPGIVTNQGTGVRWLVATPSLETAAGITADFHPTGSLPTAGGMICYGAPGIVPPAPATWDHSLIQACHLNHFQACTSNVTCTGVGNFCETNYVDCLAYGTYAGPANLLTGTPTMLDADGHSLVRTSDVHNNATAFGCGNPATPTANSGSSGSLAATTPCPGATTTTTTTTTVPIADAQALTGSQLVLTAGTTPKLVVGSKDSTISLGAGNGSLDDPVVTPGSKLHVMEVGGDGSDVTLPLPPVHWAYIGATGANKGYKYADKLGASGPIRVALVKPGKLVKAVGKPVALGLSTQPSEVRVTLTMGQRQYCLAFGGTQTFTANRKLVAKNAPAPGACP